VKGFRGDMALKIDISKAYDKVDWGFLRGMLERLGFADKWIHWMMLCVSSVNYSVLVKFEKNGSDKVYIGNLSTKETLIEKSPNFTHIVADIDNDGCDELIGHNQTVWIKDWNNEFRRKHWKITTYD
jgi:hypothetical protein